MEQQTVLVRRSDIEASAHQIKQGGYQQVYLTVNQDGTIEGHWFFGRSDFVLHPGLIVLTGLEEQTAETIAYAITMVIRNQEGYTVVD